MPDQTRGQIMGALVSSLIQAAIDAHSLDPHHTAPDWKACPYERCRERIALVREAWGVERRVGAAMIRTPARTQG